MSQRQGRSNPLKLKKTSAFQENYRNESRHAYYTTGLKPRKREEKEKEKAQSIHPGQSSKI